MKFKFKALTVGCIAAMGMASASAIEVAGATLEIYGTLYPQLQTTEMVGQGTAIGGQVSNMTTGTLTSTQTANNPNAQKKIQLNWVNSYIGFKGVKTFGDIKAGFDLQGVINNGASNTSLLADTRDAFVYLESKSMGSLALGQLDTIYKEYGDRVRMLGVSSSNFVSTAGIVSGVSWRGANAPGTPSFNTRIAGQLRYETPTWNGVTAGFSYRPDPNATLTQNQILRAMAVKWTDNTFYVGLGHESHSDYRAFSGTTVAAPAAPSIRNFNPRSKDTATRLSLGYKAGKLQLAGDVSSLMYSESAAVGKFEKYTTMAWQVSADYALNAKWNIAANYATGAAGSCSLVGGAACSTNGLGGNLLSLGGKYSFDKNVAVYGIFGSNKNNSGASFGSPTNAGGNVQNLAVGVLVKF
jgi:predicted porin